MSAHTRAMNRHSISILVPGASAAFAGLAPVLPYLWHPLLILAAVAAFAAMLSAAVPLAFAAYAPVVTAALLIFALEYWFPERADWRPRGADIAADAAFMALVQVLLPKLLMVLAVLALADWRHATVAASVWPHAWALPAQIVLMVLSVDFMRYWLHRACHRFTPLWRLHEVHHSPEILYALNVGRFHPLEKSLHFCLDSLIFLALGVAPEVIAGYFVLYSVNGFLQHSNLKLRHGVLNHVFATAELHRWHHARDPQTAACNFSNITIVWDIVFGTRHLPAGGAPAEIGILDRSYPRGFLAQMAAPFRGSATSGAITDALVHAALRVTRLVQGRRIARALRDPMRVQRALLARMLRENRDTVFGRQHGFGEIDTPETYARHVPVSDFEALRCFVEADIKSPPGRALTIEQPLHYARTSGSTGKPKDVPLTASHLNALRRIHRTAVAYQHRQCPRAFDGGILAIVSPAREGTLANGMPFGSASGIVAGATSPLLQRKFFVPAPVLAIEDSRLKYLLILRLALARPDITYFGTANPTTALALIKLYRENQSALINDLRHGGFFLADKVPADVRPVIEGRLGPCAQRADALACIALLRAPRLADIFPALKLVVTWTCASAGVAAGALKRELSPQTRVLELGYLSSEFRATISIGRRAGSGLPTLDTHYFEFIERDKWDRGEREFLTLDRIRKGVDYYIIVSTPSGLYRYFINDIVRVRGFLHRAPLLQFMQKGRGVTNLTGEKLYESQVLAAVRGAMDEAACTTRFVMMLADEMAGGYTLYVEPGEAPPLDAQRLAHAVDARLSALNIEYAAKRESGRLAAPRAHWLAADAGEAYKRHCVARGQREGQFKAPALAYARDVAFDFAAHIEHSRA